MLQINNFINCSKSKDCETRNFSSAICNMLRKIEVKKFIPDLKSVGSNFYYKESKVQQLMTFLTAKFKNNKTANEAFLHLKSKWLGNTKNQYDVIKIGNEVTWFGNNRLDINCFQAITKIEMDRLKK